MASSSIIRYGDVMAWRLKWAVMPDRVSNTIQNALVRSVFPSCVSASGRRLRSGRMTPPRWSIRRRRPPAGLAGCVA
eukprot:77122-Pyramimonas_sp.AAC.1